MDAVDRVKNKITDFEVSQERDFSAYYAVALRIEERYRIEILATDGYEVYGKYRISERHIITKAETALVESKNSLIRYYLVRFNRKTKASLKD